MPIQDYVAELRVATNVMEAVRSSGAAISKSHQETKKSGGNDSRISYGWIGEPEEEVSIG
jgi:hypothetical protein